LSFAAFVCSCNKERLLLLLLLLDWFKATEAMTTIGLILLLAAAVVIFLYMFIHSASISKNKLIIAFAVIGFAAGNFHLQVVFITQSLQSYQCSKEVVLGSS